jgi:threonine/homoserine efflux transporter RhtA
MSDTPTPPWLSDRSSADRPKGDGPGFLVCGAVFIASVLALGFVAGVFGGLIDDSGAASTSVFFVALGGVIFLSIRNPRFRRCFLRGLAAAAAFSVVLFGACLALVTATYR